MTVTAERLHELFAYDQFTGKLTRKIRVANRPAGEEAGFFGEFARLNFAEAA